MALDSNGKPPLTDSFLPTIVIMAGGTPAPRPQPAASVAIHRLTPKERAQRRLVKNAIVFGVCLVALVIVFYLLAR
jgi:hypothetical protein